MAKDLKGAEKEIKKALEYRHPSLYTDYWGPFIGWLIDYHGFTGDDIAYVMEKPHKYIDEVREFTRTSDWFSDWQEND
jgi:hypothetical protein